MTALNKQAGAGDVSQKTYYIHPAAFGSTKDPGHGHVPVVKADDFEKLRSKLEAAEKRITDYHTVLNNLAAVARRYLPDYDEHPDIQAADDLLESAAGIGVKGE